MPSKSACGSPTSSARQQVSRKSIDKREQGSAVTIDSELLTRDRADTCDTLPNQDTSDTLPHQQSTGSHMSSNRLAGDQVSGQHVDNANSNNLNNESSGCFDLITDNNSKQSGVSAQSGEAEKSNVASQNQKPKINMMEELRRARSRHHEQYLKRCQTEEVEARKAREAEEKLEEEKRLEAEKRLKAEEEETLNREAIAKLLEEDQADHGEVGRAERASVVSVRSAMATGYNDQLILPDEHFDRLEGRRQPRTNRQQIDQHLLAMFHAMRRDQARNASNERNSNTNADPAVPHRLPGAEADPANTEDWPPRNHHWDDAQQTWVPNAPQSVVIDNKKKRWSWCCW